MVFDIWPSTVSLLKLAIIPIVLFITNWRSSSPSRSSSLSSSSHHCRRHHYYHPIDHNHHLYRFIIVVVFVAVITSHIIIITIISRIASVNNGYNNALFIYCQAPMHVLSVTLTRFVWKVMEATLVPASLDMQAAAKFVKVRLKPILYLLHFI